MQMSESENSVYYDLCIVGAGMFGCAAARHASANPSLKICLIGLQEPTKEEYKSREIFGAHYDEGRIVPSNEICEGYQTLNRESLSRFRELERLSETNFYTPCGLLAVLEQNSAGLSHILDRNTPGNMQLVDLSSKELFRKRFPFIEVKKGSYVYLDEMGAGYINPRKMIEAQKKVAKLQGCHIIYDVVNEVREPVKGVHEIITESNGHFKAKRVLLCPGAFVNFKKFYPYKKFKVSLWKETAVLLKISDEEATRLNSMPTIITRNKGPENHPDIIGAYILPPIKYPDGKHYLKIGHIGEIKNALLQTSKEVKAWYESTGNEDVIRFYSEMMQKMLPSLKVEKVQGMTCVTCDSPNGFPYLDRLTPTVTVAAIGNSRGAAMCEEIGRLAAHLSLTGKWDSKLSKSLFEAVYECQ